MIDRNLWLDHLDMVLAGKDKWMSGQPGRRHVIYTDPRYTWTGNPVIDFKTRHNINRGTSIPRGIHPRRELPYWGSCVELRKKMFE